jgi:hypothetical protein
MEDRILEGPRANKKISDRSMRRTMKKAAKKDEKQRQKHKKMFGYRPKAW